MLIKCRLNVVGLNMLVIGWNNIGLVNLKNMGPCLENWGECCNDGVLG